MSAESGAEQELVELYSAYKQLSLAFAAGIILESEDIGLMDQAERLRLTSAQAARKYAGHPLASGFESCVVALEGLCEALHQGSEGAVPTDTLIEQIRGFHRSFRRQVWQVSACEYVPCGVC